MLEEEAELSKVVICKHILTLINTEPCGAHNALLWHPLQPPPCDGLSKLNSISHRQLRARGRPSMISYARNDASSSSGLFHRIESAGAELQCVFS